MIDDLKLDMPRLIYIPWYKKRGVQNMMKVKYEVQLLATEGAYLYSVKAQGNSPIPTKNPYSPLILELRRKEREFEEGKFDPNELGPNTLPGMNPAKTEPTAPRGEP